MELGEYTSWGIVFGGGLDASLQIGFYNTNDISGPYSPLSVGALAYGGGLVWNSEGELYGGTLSASFGTDISIFVPPPPMGYKTNDTKTNTLWKFVIED